MVENKECNIQLYEIELNTKQTSSKRNKNIMKRKSSEIFADQ